MHSIKNLSNKNIGSFEKIMGDFLPHAQKTLAYNKPVKVLLISDPKNALNPLGKTAHYEPSTFTVTVYVDKRHPKDIMRSLSHELVHHAQNCRGEFDTASGVGESGYAQTDEHLREMEREAYETGNLLFRDYEDGLKTKQKQHTIYIKLMKEGFQPMTTRRQLIERTIRKALLEKGVDISKFPNPLPDEEKPGFLDKGLKDNDPNDDIVQTTDDSAAAGSLSPSQSAIYLGKALGMAMGGICGGDIDAIASGDNFILDGHHRWAATIFCDPNKNVEFKRSQLPIEELIPVLRATGDAYGNARRGEPKGGDINIFQASLEDAMSAVEKLDAGNEFMAAGKAKKWFLALGSGDEAAAKERLSKSLEIIKGKAPAGKVPSRINMPVIDADKGEVEDVTKRLNKGQIDVRAPYAEPQKGKKTMKETNFRSRLREIVSRHLKEVTAGQTALAGFEEVRNQWKEDTVDNANIDALLAALKQHVTPAMEQLGLSDIDLAGKLASQGVISYTSANEEVYIDPDGAMGKYDVEVHTYDGYHGQHYNHSLNTMGEVIQYAQKAMAPEGEHTSPGEDPRQQELPLGEETLAWEEDPNEITEMMGGPQNDPAAHIKTTEDEYGPLHTIPGVSFSGNIAQDVAMMQNDPGLDGWLNTALQADEAITDEEGRHVYGATDVQDHLSSGTNQINEWEVDLAPSGVEAGDESVEEKSKELDKRIAFLQDNWRYMDPGEVEDQEELINQLHQSIQTMNKGVTTMKESKRKKRIYNERTGLLMERMLGIANLEPIGGGNWLFEEEEEETEDEPDVSYPEDSFLSSQEAQKETEGAEEDEKQLAEAFGNEGFNEGGSPDVALAVEHAMSILEQIDFSAVPDVDYDSINWDLLEGPPTAEALQHAMSILERVDFSALPSINYDDIQWDMMEAALRGARR